MATYDSSVLHRDNDSPGSNGSNGGNRGKKNPFRSVAGIAAAVALVLVTAVVGFASATTVPDGYTGVLYQFGVIQSTDAGKGLVFHVPFIQSIECIDVRGQLIEGNANAYTSDGQVVENVAYSINYTYDTNRLDQLIRTVGISNVPGRLINPNLSSIMKNVFGQYKAEVLIQNRTKCQEQMESNLREVLEPYGIIVNSFNLQNLDFEDSFEEAVRLKVEMEQKAQTAQNETALRKEEASQRVIAAEADAEAAKLAADAEAYTIRVIQEELSKSPNYVDLAMVQQWNGQFPQVMGDGVNPFVILGGSTASQDSAPSAASNPPATTTPSTHAQTPAPSVAPSSEPTPSPAETPTP